LKILVAINADFNNSRASDFDFQRERP
jgi:hypothetical protein